MPSRPCGCALLRDHLDAAESEPEAEIPGSGALQAACAPVRHLADGLSGGSKVVPRRGDPVRAGELVDADRLRDDGATETREDRQARQESEDRIRGLSHLGEEDPYRTRKGKGRLRRTGVGAITSSPSRKSRLDGGSKGPEDSSSSSSKRAWNSKRRSRRRSRTGRSNSATDWCSGTQHRARLRREVAAQQAARVRVHPGFRLLRHQRLPPGGDQLRGAGPGVSAVEEGGRGGRAGDPDLQDARRQGERQGGPRTAP